MIRCRGCDHEISDTDPLGFLIAPERDGDGRPRHRSAPVCQQCAADLWAHLASLRD